LKIESAPEIVLSTCVPELVRAQAAARPEAIAVAAGSEVLTYSELDRRANQLANHLRSVGVSRGTLVALYLKRSPSFIVAALAILKAGGAYLPLDPESPAGRIAFSLADSGAAAVITSEGLRDRLPGGSWRVLDLDRDRARINSCAEPAPLAVVHPEDLAYVIYTSGSTGQPKGVEVEHSSLANLVGWHNRAFNVSPADRASFMAALGFDAAVWELWPYLAAGASVHVPEEGVRNDAKALRDWLLREKITVSFAVTAMAESLLGLNWPADAPLRYLLTGADVLRRRPAARLPFALVNNYGPTEYTVVATSGVVASEGTTALPSIGHPIDNTTTYILDEAGRELPQGEAGELYLGGAGLARGYRNQPALTEDRFVVNPLGGRLYRTGDLAHVLPTGEIEFLGRVDEQVKIRGFRIEPNEIVAALDRCAGVQGSAVVAREDGGEKRLVAYVVPAADANLTAPGLREQLSKLLPDYMIPAALVAVEAIPQTVNGKVDCTALPEPGSENLLREEAYIAPRTMAEERLAALIAPLVRVDRVGVNDNFFLLGGHSLLGAQLITRISDSFGIQLPLLSLFDHPTLAGMAAAVERLILDKIELEKTEQGRIEAGNGNELQSTAESAEGIRR